MHQVLTLDHTGQPRHWISCEDAVTYVAKNLVVWSLGKSIATFHGGFKKMVISLSLKLRQLLQFEVNHSITKSLVKFF